MPAGIQRWPPLTTNSGGNSSSSGKSGPASRSRTSAPASSASRAAATPPLEPEPTTTTSKCSRHLDRPSGRAIPRGSPRPGAGGRAVGEDQAVPAALVHELERRARLDDDDAARRKLEALGLVAEEHRERPLVDEEDLFLHDRLVATARSPGRVLPEMRPRVLHVRVQRDLDQPAHRLLGSPARHLEALILRAENGVCPCPPPRSTRRGRAVASLATRLAE